MPNARKDRRLLYAYLKILDAYASWSIIFIVYAKDICFRNLYAYTGYANNNKGSDLHS